MSHSRITVTLLILALFCAKSFALPSFFVSSQKKFEAFIQPKSTINENFYVQECPRGVFLHLYVGSYIDDVIAKIEAGSTYYYHSDRQFNVRGISDSTGAVVELYAYSVYGKQIIMDTAGTVQVGSAVNNFYGYTGRYIDSETGLWYFRARYFDAEMGRFINRDPLGYVDGMSLYNGYFAQGFGVDPSGLALVDKVPNVPKGYIDLGIWYDQNSSFEEYDYIKNRWVASEFNGKLDADVSFSASVKGEVTIEVTGDISISKKYIWKDIAASARLKISGSASGNISFSAAIKDSWSYSRKWSSDVLEVTLASYRKDYRYIVYCCKDYISAMYHNGPPEGFEKTTYYNEGANSKMRMMAKKACPTYAKNAAIYRSKDYEKGNLVNSQFVIDPRKDSLKYRKTIGGKQTGEASTHNSTFFKAEKERFETLLEDTYN